MLFQKISLIIIIFQIIGFGNLFSSEWKSVGPYGGWSSDIYCLEQNSGNSQILYAGSEDGGIFKSLDAGQQWFPVYNSVYEQNITAITTDPVNHDIIYAGSSIGILLKSVDGGNHWLDISGSLPGNCINEIVVDPVNSQIIYVALSNRSAVIGGIFKSTDGGNTWVELSSSFQNHNISSIAIDPSNSSLFYAGSVSSGILYKSNDSGVTWSTTNISLTNSINEICLNPLNPQSILIGTSGDGIIKSVSGGSTWFSVNCDSVGFWQSRFSHLQFDQTDTNIVYAGLNSLASTWTPIYKSVNSGLDWFGCDQGHDGYHVYDIMIDSGDPNVLFTATMNHSIFKSINSGNDWFASNHGFGIQKVHCIETSSINPAIWIAGTERGVFTTIDAGSNWNQSVASNAYISDITWHPDSATVCCVMKYSYSAGIFKSNNNGQSWSVLKFLGGEPTSLVINPLQPNIMYIGRSCDLLKSVDGGNTWTASDSGMTNPSVIDIVMDHQNSDILYALTETNIWKSTDAASTWNDLGFPFYLPHNKPNTITIHPQIPTKIYVGIVNGLVTSDDGGANWQFVHMTGYSVMDIDFEPSNPNIMYVATNGNGILKSTNGGQTWTTMNDNLFNKNVESLKLSQTDSTNYLLAGTLGNSIYRYDYIPTTVPENDIMPAKIKLYPVYPNPFNPTTTIEYYLPETNHIKLNLFNITGQKVKKLFSGTKSIGIHKYILDGSNLASGLYFIQMQANDFQAMQKILLVK